MARLMVIEFTIEDGTDETELQRTLTHVDGVRSTARLDLQSPPGSSANPVMVNGSSVGTMHTYADEQTGSQQEGPVT